MPGPQERARPRSASSHVSAVLVFLAAAIVVFAVMAITVGRIGSDLHGLWLEPIRTTLFAEP